MVRRPNSSSEDGVFRCGACGAELFRSRREVRLGLRLAELLRADGRGRGRDRGGRAATACGASRSAAPRATRTSGTCSPTARTRPASATASTRSRSTSRLRTTSAVSGTGFDLPRRQSVLGSTLDAFGDAQGELEEGKREAVDVKSDRLAGARRRERRGRAARQRASPSPRGRSGTRRAVPALLRHAGRHPPALGRGRAASEVVASPSNKGNGMTSTPTAGCSSASTSTSSLVRMEPDGTARPRGARLPLPGQGAEQPERRRASRSDGSIYFSDPWYGRMPGFGVERERELGLQGVFRIAPGGGDAAARRRQGRVRAAERPLLLARRVAALHQRHPRRATSRSTTSTPTARSPTAGCSSTASARA